MWNSTHSAVQICVESAHSAWSPHGIYIFWPGLDLYMPFIGPLKQVSAMLDMPEYLLSSHPSHNPFMISVYDVTNLMSTYGNHQIVLY